MLTIIDFAKLALYVYKDPKDNILLHDFIKFNHAFHVSDFDPKRLPVNGMYEVTVDSVMQSNTRDDFYASFFVKVENCRAIGGVIAIRGTVASMLGNDTADIYSWWKDVFDEKANPIPPINYVHKAMSFYHKVRKYQGVLNISPINTFVVGHSLGGAVAALLPTQRGALARAITFNAPGIMGMDGVRNLWDAVINFRAVHDFVSAIAIPVGNQFSYVVPEKDTQAANAFAYAREHIKDPISRINVIGDLIETTDFLKSVLPQHSMDNLLQELENSRGINNRLLAVDTFGTIEPLLRTQLPQFESPLYPK